MIEKFNDRPPGSPKGTSALYAPVLAESGEITQAQRRESEGNLLEQYEFIERILKIVQEKKEDENITIYDLMTDASLKQFVIDSGIITNEQVLKILKEDILNTKKRDITIQKEKENMRSEISTTTEVEVNSLQAYQIFKVLLQTMDSDDKAYYASMTSRNIENADKHTKEVFAKKSSEEIWKSFQGLSFDENSELDENIQLQTNAGYLLDNDLTKELTKDQQKVMKEKVAVMALQVMDQLVETTNTKTDDLETLCAQNFKAHELWYRHTPKESSEYKRIIIKSVQLGRAITERIHTEEITEEEKLKAEHGILSYLPEGKHQRKYEDLLDIHAKRADDIFDAVVKDVQKNGGNLKAQLDAGRNKAEFSVAMLARDRTNITKKQEKLLEELCNQKVQGVKDNDERMERLQKLRKELVSSTETGYVDKRIESLRTDIKEVPKGIARDLRF